MRAAEIFDIRPTSAKPAKSYGDIKYARNQALEINCGPKTAAWGDSVPPNFSHLPLVLSERVVRAIESNGFSGIKLSRISVRCLGSGEPARPYYIAEPNAPAPELIYRLWKLEGGVYRLCAECLIREEIDAYRREQGIKIIECRVQRIPKCQKAKSDFMAAPDTDAGVNGFGGFLCSRRVVELAYREAWTNLAFVPIDSFGDMRGNVADNPWPPELWYPPYQPAD